MNRQSFLINLAIYWKDPQKTRSMLVWSTRAGKQESELLPGLCGAYPQGEWSQRLSVLDSILRVISVQHSLGNKQQVWKVLSIQQKQTLWTNTILTVLSYRWANHNKITRLLLKQTKVGAKGVKGMKAREYDTTVSESSCVYPSFRAVCLKHKKSKWTELPRCISPGGVFWKPQCNRNITRTETSSSQAYRVN